MALQDRDTLKNYFKHGSVPSEVHFQDLIDSLVNKVDDGLDKDLANGLQLSPRGTSKKVISFFENIKDKSTSWSVALNPDPRSKGLGFSDGTKKEGEALAHFPLYLKKEAGIGVGTTNPNYAMDVNGLVGMHGRIGTFAKGSIPADGKWHDVIADLDQVHAFEIMALANGKKHEGKYAMTHAIAMAAYGGTWSRKKIKQTKVYYRWFWNAIKIRWKSDDTYKFRLQIKTRSNYGLGNNEEQAQITYRIMKLWDENDVTW
ncbi:MAG: hypothetical protein ACI97N_001651 [Cognaticolwellia sp.]|jgi:hypothetical protein|tara:strand:- start:40 stop:816 length:777 start_codon:yes stop_codon:yes gene_type:complete